MGTPQLLCRAENENVPVLRGAWVPNHIFCKCMTDVLMPSFVH